jgi:hypothetical protein
VDTYRGRDDAALAKEGPGHGSCRCDHGYRRQPCAMGVQHRFDPVTDHGLDHEKERRCPQACTSRGPRQPRGSAEHRRDNCADIRNEAKNPSQYAPKAPVSDLGTSLLLGRCLSRRPAWQMISRREAHKTARALASLNHTKFSTGLTNLVCPKSAYRRRLEKWGTPRT